MKKIKPSPRVHPRHHRQALLVAGCLPLAAIGAETPATDLLDLDLEALTKIEVKSAAGLTKTDARRAPVPLTELDAKTIRQSGARDLNKLIENEVPNAQFIFHHGHAPHLGFRGLISDREDKYLYQVNGRTMNNRLTTGADMERGLPLLGDIAKVSVVRGPASATHGAGAISGVINVETHTGLTYQGAEVSARHGVIDAYTAGEVLFGRKLADDTGVFIYYGQVERQGMDSDYYIGRSFPAANGLPANQAGEPAPFDGPDLYAPGSDDTQRKLHASLVKGPLELWVRYVEDGYTLREQREVYTAAKPASVNPETWVTGRKFDNTQFTTALRYKEELSATWTLDSMLSFDRYTYDDARSARVPSPLHETQEDELFGRAIAVWSPGDRHSLGFGFDYSHETFTELGKSDALDAGTGRPLVPDREWSTDTISFMAEHQWRLHDRLTLFTSARTDKHTYTDWLLSPRGTLVYTPDDKQTIKLMAGESVRRSGDSELWGQYQRSRMPAGTVPGFVPPERIPEPESLTAIELAYEYAMSNGWTTGVNLFHQSYEAIGWVGGQNASIGVGEFEMAGGELTISYRKPGTRFDFSQGIVNLLDTKTHLDPSATPPGFQGISSEPFGGDDLLAWSSYLSKISLIQDLSPRFTASTSLTVYWGFDGAQDAANFMNATYPASQLNTGTPRVSPGNDDPFGANVYWNVGLEYRPTENWTLRVDGYNLAALIDERSSKRNYYFRVSEYSVESASCAFSARYAF